jgi:hypothetical protein
MNEEEARKIGRAFALGVLDAILGRGASPTAQPSTKAGAEPRWMKINVVDWRTQ